MPPTKKSVPVKSATKKRKVSSHVRSIASARTKMKTTKESVRTAGSQAKAKASVAAKAQPTPKGTQISLDAQVQEVLASLKRLADKRVFEDMSKRYGIYTNKALGVSMSNIQKVAKPLGRNHELAAALWETGWYEARMLTSFVDDPALVTSEQMDRWCREFDNWGIVDTLCFNLFDRTPYAWRKVAQWCKEDEEFVKRAGFALLWSLTVHDKQASDDQFVQGLVLILRGANDERHLVKKAVNMALRAVGKRNAVLNSAAVAIARRLAESSAPAARWVGKDALRELTSAAIANRLAKRRPTEDR